MDAAGGRTDLVMGNRIDNPSEVEQAAFGMVLTEWKLATEKSQIDKKYEEGIEQASLYSAGVLAGVELTDTRYIVVVTDDTASREDVFEGDITYRYVNIAVHPKVPSVAARS